MVVEDPLPPAMPIEIEKTNLIRNEARGEPKQSEFEEDKYEDDIPEEEDGQEEEDDKIKTE
jgi:hypothetical protein